MFADMFFHSSKTFQETGIHSCAPTHSRYVHFPMPEICKLVLLDWACENGRLQRPHRIQEAFTCSSESAPPMSDGSPRSQISVHKQHINWVALHRSHRPARLVIPQRQESRIKPAKFVRNLRKRRARRPAISVAMLVTFAVVNILIQRAIPSAATVEKLVPSRHNRPRAPKRIIAHAAVLRRGATQTWSPSARPPATNRSRQPRSSGTPAATSSGRSPSGTIQWPTFPASAAAATLSKWS